MKLLVKLMLAALVLAVLAPFTVLKDDDGKPLMSFSDLKMPELAVPGLQDVEGAGDKLSGAVDQDTVIYQWTDAAGNLNFTNEAPPEGIEFTVRSYDPAANVIQAVKPESGTLATMDEERGGKTTGEAQADGKIGNPYSPQKIEKLFDDAKNVQQQLNERATQQQQMIENL